jgi:hypothetical protein
MEVGWFLNELNERCKWCDFEPLVCTVTDGENGGWFRNIRWESNYWGAFYHPFLHQVRHGQTNVRPTFIHDYLDRHGAHGQVIVRTGAWNTGFHHGVGFVQWTGSQMQRDAWARLGRGQPGAARGARRSLVPLRQRRTATLPGRGVVALVARGNQLPFLLGRGSWVSRAHAGLDDTQHWLDLARAAR